MTYNLSVRYHEYSYTNTWRINGKTSESQTATETTFPVTTFSVQQNLLPGESTLDST